MQNTSKLHARCQFSVYYKFALLWDSKGDKCECSVQSQVNLNAKIHNVINCAMSDFSTFVKNAEGYFVETVTDVTTKSYG